MTKSSTTFDFLSKTKTKSFLTFEPYFFGIAVKNFDVQNADYICTGLRLHHLKINIKTQFQFKNIKIAKNLA